MTENKRTLVLTDNAYAHKLAIELGQLHGGVDVYQSPNGVLEDVPRLNVRAQVSMITSSYDLVLSIHCKQIFPPELVAGVRCVNVHPGLNPYNRGWFPQVFSIINKLPSGVTIHEIDNELDHGPIIASARYEIEPWDTSGSAYKKIMAIERDLLIAHFLAIRDGAYKAMAPQEQGNLNLKKDFDKLKRIDLEQTGKFVDFVDHLRALTHDDFRNAYFLDSSGRKVFMRIILEPEDA